MVEVVVVVVVVIMPMEEVVTVVARVAMRAEVVVADSTGGVQQPTRLVLTKERDPSYLYIY